MPLRRTAWLEIDTDALVSNLAAIRAVLPTGTRLEPVVKADGYGHGMVAVARVLAGAGADGLCVATLDEAVQLRQAGLSLPVLVLYPVPAAFAAEAAAGAIALAAGDRTLLERLLAAIDWPAAGVSPELRLHLEIETGLGRGGVLPQDAVEAARAIGATAGAGLAGIWSHLQDPGSTARTVAQVDRLSEVVAELIRAGIAVEARHLAASGALVLGNVPAAEAVRPGLITYGIVPDDVGPVQAGLAARLRPAMALRARPVRVVDLPAGHGISYGPTFTTSRRARIATLPLGYGDGWSRALSNRAQALVRGARVPLVGNVAMDAVMADVTEVPGPAVDVDDEFTLLGADGDDQIGAAEIARQRDTNAWEVVTAMSGRLARVYHAAAGIVGVRGLVPGDDWWPGSSSGTATSPNSRSTRS